MPTPASGANPVDSVALLQAFKASTNYREFVHAALQRPEIGGRLYARMAFFRCTQAATTARMWQEKQGGGSGEGRTAPEHDAARALQAVLAACEGLDEQFGGTSQLMALMINGGQRVQDPYLALVNRMAHDRQDQMAQARQLGDPLVVSEALLLALSRDLQRDPLLFGESGVDARRAAEVIICELMGTCTSSLRAISGCLLEGCSSLDLRVEIRARHLMHPEQFDELVRRIKSRYLVG